MKVKALYTIAQLAELSGMDEQKLRRWILRSQMSVVRHGRSCMIPMFAFRDAFPLIWESIRRNNQITSGTCQACGGTVRP